MDFPKFTQILNQIADRLMGAGGFVALTTGATTSGTLGYDSIQAGFILYDNLAGGPYTVGETVTGGTSAATGVVVEDTGARLVLEAVVGTFVNNEVLTGGTSAATSDSDGGLTFYAFEVGDIITGATSGATGTVDSLETGELLLTGITGTFQNNEVIDGSESGTQAKADGVVVFSNVGNYYMLQVDGAADLVLERLVQQNGTTIEGLTIYKGTTLKGSFTDLRITSGIVYAYSKP